jgi:excisionase family DNA binding protein
MNEDVTFDNLPKVVSEIRIKLDRLENMIQDLLDQRPEEFDKFLNIDEAAKFLSTSKATLYRKVMDREIPVMKQMGRLYFSSKELREFILAGRKKTREEIEREAATYLATKGRGIYRTRK